MILLDGLTRKEGKEFSNIVFSITKEACLLFIDTKSARGILQAMAATNC